MSDRNDFSDIGQEELIKKLIEVKKNNKGLEIPEQFANNCSFWSWETPNSMTNSNKSIPIY